MERSLLYPPQKFKTPEEELAFLREELKRRNVELEKEGQPFERVSATRELIQDYTKTEPAKVISDENLFTPKAENAIVLALKPEAHDRKIEELLGILLEKGVRNALSVLEKLGDPHLDDDFHRFLVQYILVGEVPGVESDKSLWKALHFKLFEIILPDEESDKEEDFKRAISVMEQFYAGMLAISDGKDTAIGKNYFTLELAISNQGNDLVFYAAVPSDKSGLLEKHILALYPKARISEVKDDYNIFNSSGASIGAFGKLSDSPIFPLKIFESFGTDPLAVLINVFSKLKKEGEGAALQIVVNPVGDYFLKKYGIALDEVRRGVSPKDAGDIPWSFGEKIVKTFKDAVFGIKVKKDKQGMPVVDEEAVKRITEKLKSVIVNTNIRLIVSAETTSRAREVLSEIMSAFGQFSEAGSNGIIFEIPKSRSGQLRLFHKFAYRLFSYDEPMPLNLRELATIFHFPKKELKSRELKQSGPLEAPAPLDLEKVGTLLGVNRYRGIETNVYIGREDRMRHFYIVGQTGTGKTTLLKNMIIQDIEAGNGVCMIDPHGTDIRDVLASIPSSRIDDVIYFDPASTERPFGLNMLEYDQRFPEQKTFVVNELLSIFNKLFDMKVAGGPAFEQYFRNSAMLVMEHPESGNTLLDIARVLSDKTYRELKLANCKNPLIIQFWDNATKTSGEQSLANYVPYITNKFDAFLSNDVMRPIVAQESSSINFRDIMDNRKILLVNLSKGRLGDINANLLGLILVGKFLMAALSRVDIIGRGEVSDFYLYIDEFQNVTTDSIATILSEARKYRLSLTIAHQYIKQLTEEIRNAVFGNVGSLAVFRVGSEDAEILAKQLEPVFTQRDIVNLENRRAFVKILSRGQPTKPFSLETIAPKLGDYGIAEEIIRRSGARYGRARAEVESEILRKYKNEHPSVINKNT